jgi:cellulose biosynthesis protein BcsQ
VVTNGKGGVGKTSIVANVAGLAAQRGIRTLVVDLDPQANLAVDLGAQPAARTDAGRSLLWAARDERPLAVTRDVRPGIDAVFAGAATRELSNWLASAVDDDPTVLMGVRQAVASLDGNHDLVLFDTPPAPAVMAEAGMVAAQWIVAPVRADRASIDGLALVREAVDALQAELLPTGRMLGVALFDIASNSTAVIDEMRTMVTDAAPWAGPVFRTVIRRSERTAFDARRWGLLAGEYRDQARAAMTSPGGRARIETDGLSSAVTRFTRAADTLADDYHRLGDEVLQRMMALVA